MLGKDILIANIKRQREYIEAQLTKIINTPSDDGDMSYRYVGYISTYVITYFESKGVTVKELTEGKFFPETRGLPVYLFTPSDHIELTAEELNQAESVEVPPIQSDNIPSDAMDYLQQLADSLRGYTNEDEDDYDYDDSDNTPPLYS